MDIPCGCNNNNHNHRFLFQRGGFVVGRCHCLYALVVANAFLRAETTRHCRTNHEGAIRDARPTMETDQSPGQGLCPRLALCRSPGTGHGHGRPECLVVESSLYRHGPQSLSRRIGIGQSKYFGIFQICQNQKDCLADLCAQIHHDGNWYFAQSLSILRYRTQRTIVICRIQGGPPGCRIFRRRISKCL